MRKIAGHPIIDIGAEPQQAAVFVPIPDHLDGEKRRVIDANADFLHRSDQKVFAVLAFQDRGEQPHQRRPADRRSHVKPRAVAGDSHVQIAAKRRIPQMDWRQTLAGRVAASRAAVVSPSSVRSRSALASPWFTPTLVACSVTKGNIKPLVWWFRSSLHSPGKSVKRTSGRKRHA